MADGVGDVSGLVGGVTCEAECTISKFAAQAMLSSKVKTNKPTTAVFMDNSVGDAAFLIFRL